MINNKELNMKKINKEQLMKVYNIKTGGIRHTGKEPDLKGVYAVLNNMYNYIFLKQGEIDKKEVEKSMNTISDMMR